MTRAYQVKPESVAMRERLQLSIGLDSAGAPHRQAGLCRFDPDDKVWSWIDNGTHSDNQAAGNSAGGGIFAALGDTTAPTIAGLNFAPGHKYYDRKPVVKFKLSDNLSGFEDDRSIDVRIDGVWLLPEFDPEKGRVSATLREALDLGPHELKISVVDRAGNRVEKVVAFEVVKRSAKK
jgi:hypothetical protein